MNSKSLMVMGAGSDVGKSLLVAGLCRAYAKRGLRVRPFKPQNMSNNAAVTKDGGEIGRAQALQARACGVPLSVHMNPVLLKPQSETGAQVVVQGQVMGTESARGYRALKPVLLPSIIESYNILRHEADLVLVEGAGSPAEINLRDSDVANFGFALEAQVPVVLVGDVERGGVIAQLVGTHALLQDAEKALMRGFIVNKFRGDVSLFEQAMDEIASRTGWAGLGVVAWFDPARRLPQEDSASLASEREKDAPILVAVPRLPRISNFDDLDPLMAEDDVSVVFVEPGHALPARADVVVLPGSKATLGDLAALKDEGWDIDLTAHVRRGGWVVGLCGGYQMLGNHVTDPDGVEGSSAGAEGLGLLDIDTVMTDDKALETVNGVEAASGESVHGYEMHMGLSDGAGRKRPWLMLDDRPDGAVSDSGRVMGGYVHGVFATDGFRHAFLARIREGRAGGVSYEHEVEKTLDALAAHLEASLDLDGLLALAD